LDITASIVKTDISCNGKTDGMAVAQATGGTGSYQYKWNDAASTTNDTISGLGAGSIQVTVTDQNSCSQVFSTSIEEPSKFAATLVSSKNVNCFGDSTGSIEISATGGRTPYSFSWSNGSTTQNISTLKQGTYKLTATDLSNCVSNLEVVLTQSPEIVASITTDSVYCFGTKTGKAVVLATGGTGNLSYSWNDLLNTKNDTLDKVNAGDYICTVEDGIGCKKNFNATINTLSAMTLAEDAANHTNAICNGTSTGSLGLKATGGSGLYEYSYNNSEWTSNVVFKDLAAGLYKFIMRDKIHPECVLSDTAKIQILEPNALVLKDLNVSNTSGWSTNDGSIQLTADGGPEGGYIFTLYPGDVTSTTGSFTVSTGNYMISVTDALGCDTVSSDVTYVGPYSVDIRNSKLALQLEVYPNPSEGILTIQYFDPGAKSATIEIYNVQGAIIYKQEHFNKQNNFFVEKLDLRNKPKGIYIVKVNNTVFKDRIILK
jgi:hypothetical protein